MYKKSLKDIFINEVAKIVGDKKEAGVALSAGIDSTCVLFALLELGIKTTVYSFHVEKVFSRDYLYAKKTAEHFSCDFVECVIPRPIDRHSIIELIEKYGLKKKTDIECTYPFLFLLPKVREEVLVTGACADGHFCLSKKGRIHYRHTVELLREFRDGLFDNPNYAQVETFTQICKNNFDNLKIDTPYNKQSIRDYFYDMTWDECNKPKEKFPLRDMFPKMLEQITIFNHTNYQCGDSEIRDIFEVLLDDADWNSKNRSRMIDVYRDMYNILNM